MTPARAPSAFQRTSPCRLPLCGNWSRPGSRRTRVEQEPPMAARKRVASPEPSSSQTDPAVIAFLRELDHPLKQEVEAVRQIILGVSPEIREGIKWNAPSFRTTEYFATLNLRK